MKRAFGALAIAWLSSGCFLPIDAGSDFPDAAGGGSSSTGGGSSSAGGGSSSAGGGSSSVGGGSSSVGGGSSSVGGGSSSVGGGSSSAGGGSSSVGGGSSSVGGGSSSVGGGSSSVGGGSSSAGGSSSSSGGGFTGGGFAGTGGGSGVGGGTGVSCTGANARNIFFLPAMALDGLSVERPGELSLRFSDQGQIERRQLDFNGQPLALVREAAHSSALWGVRASNGRGLVAFFGGGFAQSSQQLSFVDASGANAFSTVVSPALPSASGLAYNPSRDEFALFWSVYNQVPTAGQIVMQTRFMDGGVGFTMTVANEFLQHGGAAAAAGRYFVVGDQSVNVITDQGAFVGSAPLAGTARSLATDLAQRAGVTVHGFDGGSLSFAQIESAEGTVTQSIVPLLSGIMEAYSGSVWDAVNGVWRVVYSQFGQSGLTLVTITPAGGVVSVPVACNVTTQRVQLAISGRALFVGYSDFTAGGTGVIRIDL